MKKVIKRRLAAVLLAILLAAVCRAAGFASDDAGPAEKAVTLMVYMCGSNLESGGAATADLMEMASGGYGSYIARFSGYLLGKAEHLQWEDLRAACSAEAGMLPGAGSLPGRKDFGSYSVEETEISTTLLNQELNNSGSSVELTGNEVPDSSETQISITTLWQEVDPVPAAKISPVSDAFIAETLTVPASVSLAMSFRADSQGVIVFSPADTGESRRYLRPL